MSGKKLNFLKLEDKAKILDYLRKGYSAASLAREFNVAKSTICGFKKREESILQCVKDTVCGSGQRKTLRKSELPKMERYLYRWFIQMKNKNKPVNTLMIKAKAKELHLKINEIECNFNASDGWLQRFKKRYDVKLSMRSGEKLSSQANLVKEFELKLKAKMDEMQIRNDQLYNVEKTGLFWKLLPGKTYGSTIEETAPDMKTEKQRISFLCCANESGSHRLRLLIIGNAKNPQFDCLAEYKYSKSARMTSNVLREWFHYSFVPQVRAFVEQTCMPRKAILIINNAPCYLAEQELKTEDGNIIVMFMPSNVTPIIQPMMQNAIKLTKLYYRNSLLASIAAKRTGLRESMRKFTLGNAITLLDEAWSRINTETLAKCLIDLPSDIQSDNNDQVDPLIVPNGNCDAEINYLMGCTMNLLEELNPQNVYSLANIKEWNEDAFLDNKDIKSEDETDNGDCNVIEPTRAISTSEAIQIFNKALEWAGTENVDLNDIVVLKRLREKAVFKLLKENNQRN